MNSTTRAYLDGYGGRPCTYTCGTPEWDAYYEGYDEYLHDARDRHA